MVQEDAIYDVGNIVEFEQLTVSQKRKIFEANALAQAKSPTSQTRTALNGAPGKSPLNRSNTTGSGVLARGVAETPGSPKPPAKLPAKFDSARSPGVNQTQSNPKDSFTQRSPANIDRSISENSKQTATSQKQNGGQIAKQPTATTNVS